MVHNKSPRKGEVIRHIQSNKARGLSENYLGNPAHITEREVMENNLEPIKQFKIYHEPIGGIIKKLQNLLSPKRALIIRNIRKDMNQIVEYWNFPCDCKAFRDRQCGCIANQLLDELYMEIVLNTKYEKVVSPYFSRLLLECGQARLEGNQLLAQQIFLEAICTISLTHKEEK